VNLHSPDMTGRCMSCGEMVESTSLLGCKREPYVSQREKAVLAENAQLRIWLAFAIGGMRLYADDGELQDSSKQPFIDFKRDSIAEIEAKFQQRTANALSGLSVD
jgi:hypothetical protein